MMDLKKSNYTLSYEKPSRIIIHHTACVYDNIPGVDTDTTRFQANLFMDFVIDGVKNRESNFHFLIDRVGDDFYPIVSQPLLTKCIFSDVPEDIYNDIHIAFIGNYNNNFPKNRMFKVLSYRLLIPLARQFRLSENSILLHRDVSLNAGCVCPGVNIDRSDVLKFFRTFKSTTLKRWY